GVTYTATPANAGNSPTYQWTVNGNLQASTGAALTYTPSQNDVIRAIVSTGGISGLCLSTTTAISNVLTASVTGTLASSVAISASSNSSCQGQLVSFTATAGGTGSAPSYSWLVNNNQVSTASSSYSYVPSNGDVVKVITTKGGTGTACITGSPATSTGIVVLVTPTVSSSVTIIPSSNAVCSTLGVSFTASGINSGANPVFSWRVNDVPSGIGTTFAYEPSFGDVVKVVMSSSGIACLVSNPVTSAGLAISVTSIGQSPCLLPSPSTISGPVNVSANQTGVVYSVESVPGISYVWTVPAGATIVSGQGTNSITVNFTASVAGTITLQESNNLGSASTSLTIVQAIPTSTNDQSISASWNISPNPFSDETFVQISGALTYEILDLSGKV
ncbi:MAG: hypothetical protein K2Q22_15635, partial [Cytophagales bacterium]|nr:hypothetical protein [Cytophagales bacterium]